VTRPPRFAESLMERSLVATDRAVVLGDLHEEFQTHAARDGLRAARRWYWRQVLRSLPSNLRRAARHAIDARQTARPARRALRPRREVVMQDIRYAVRSLLATPTFTIVVLVVLALGIGATTAIFSVVDAVVLKGVPFPRGDRLVAVSEPSAKSPRRNAAVSAADFADLRARQSTFEDLAAVRGAGRGFTLRSGDLTESPLVMAVSASLLPVLRIAPALGRAFTADDEVPGHERVAILSDGFWRRRFGADRAILGRTLAFDTGSWTIVGVMPPSFTYPIALRAPVDVWVPFVPYPRDLVRGNVRNFTALVVGRLKPGVSIAQGRADLERITATIRQAYPTWLQDRSVAVVSLRDSIVGPAKPWMLMLLGSVTFVLLIACVNVANLLLARATARSRDVAVRAALGASRWTIVRGLLIESLILSAIGTALGVCLAVWGVHVLRASLPPSLPRLDEVAVNYRVLVAAACAALAVAVGVTPVWQSPASALSTSLNESGRSGTAGASGQRIRSVLLVAEVGLAMVLLVGAGLFISSFIRLTQVDLGFGLGNILSVTVSTGVDVPKERVAAESARVREAIAAAFEQVARIPAIEKAALVSGTQPLLLGSDRLTITVPGKPVFTDPDDYADYKYISPAYFDVLGVPLLAGRVLTDADAAPGAPRMVLLNDVARSRYFGGTDPIGASLLLSRLGSYTVAGVVRSVRLQGPEAELRPEVYLPLDLRQPLDNPLMTIVMRTSRDPASFASSVRAAMRSAAPGLVAPDPQTYFELFAKLVSQRRFNMIVLALFGLLAITIAGAGIYGVMACIVEQRTTEIGLRMALGAEPARVLRMVLGRASVYLAVGVAIGVSGGWMLARLVQAFLFKGDPHDPVVFGGAMAVLVAVGLIAAFVPARRAARVDPAVALRAQ
jgi:putative ABC transport system permease protein